MDTIDITIEKIKTTKKLRDVNNIFVPGERGNQQTDGTIKSGTIEIENNLLEGLRKAAG